MCTNNGIDADNTNYGDTATIKEVIAVIHTSLFQTAITYFQVVRQFRSPCISWIHGDTNIASWIQFQFSAFKHKCSNPCLNCCSDTKHLLCYYWQHLYCNPVKFIKTGPHSWRRQTFEKLRNRYVFMNIQQCKGIHTTDGTKQAYGTFILLKHLQQAKYFVQWRMLKLWLPLVCHVVEWWHVPTFRRKAPPKFSAWLNWFSHILHSSGHH